MYRIYSDSNLLHHDNLEQLRILDPSVELELNKTGSFVFGVSPEHPRLPFVKRMRSIIQLWQDDFLLFRGRVLDEEIGWHNEKTFVCEGDLAFLLDSTQRPIAFSGTAAEFLAFALGIHNDQVEEEKRFQVGSVTVEDLLTVDSTEYLNTLETLQKYLVEAFGGYLQTRQEDGINYIDYLSELSVLSPQKIVFGKNLLDLKRIRKGSDIVSAIIPLGATLKDTEGNDTGKRLTIAEVNDGLDYLVDEAAKAEHGFVVRPVIFEGITDATELKSVGEAHLAELVNQWETIELTAADLSAIDQDITSFHLGTQVQAESSPHGLNQRMLVTKLSLKLFEPWTNKMTMGKTIPAFSEAVKGVSDSQSVILQTVERNAQAASEAVYNVEQNLLASIQVAEQNIQTVVAENYYLKEDTDALISSVSTTVEQTQKSVEIQFNQFSQDIEAVAAGVDAEFEEQRKYIRFEDGKILLGEVGNELELQIANDRISFLQDGAEVAYFSNRKLYVTDAEILHSLQLGNFSFMPRANGNLSFKKV